MRTLVIIAILAAFPGKAAAPRTYTRFQMGYAFSCGMLAGQIKLIKDAEISVPEERTKEMRKVFVDTGCESVELMFIDLAGKQ